MPSYMPELQALRVDHEEARLGGGAAEEDRADHRVEPGRLARPRSPRRRAGAASTRGPRRPAGRSRHARGRGRAGPSTPLNSFERKISRRDTVDGSGFGTSMATLPRAGHRPEDTDRAGLHRERQVVGEVHHLVHLDPGPGLELVPVITGPGLIRAMCPLTPEVLEPLPEVLGVLAQLLLALRAAGALRPPAPSGATRRAVGTSRPAARTRRSPASRGGCPPDGAALRPDPGLRGRPRPLLTPRAGALGGSLRRCRPGHLGRQRDGGRRRRRAGLDHDWRGRRARAPRRGPPAAGPRSKRTRAARRATMRPREACVGRLRDAETCDRHQGEEQEQPAHIAQGAAEHGRDPHPTQPAPVQPPPLAGPESRARSPVTASSARVAPTTIESVPIAIGRVKAAKAHTMSTTGTR